MLKLDYFSYSKATNTCCMDLIFWNLYCFQLWFLPFSNDSNSQLLQYQGSTLGVRRISNQTDNDVTCPKSCDQGKIIKKDWKIIRVEKNPTHLDVLLFFKSIFWVIWKETVFLFFKKTQKPHSDLSLLHHAISPFSELHNNNFLYQWWHSNLRVKKCTPSLVSLMLLVNSLQSCNALQACAQETEKSHFHKTLQFHVKFVYMPH